MKKNLKNSAIMLIIAIISSLVVNYHVKLQEIIRNRFDGLATMLSAVVVIIVYYIEQRSKKINAARLVLKEIDFAMPIVKDLANENKYDQKTIAIATDNWPNQIHYFVKDMTQDEIDQINKIYSRGKYINKCIDRVDEYKKSIREKIYQEELDKPENNSKTPESIFNEKIISDKVGRADAVPNALVNFAFEAAKEIKDAQGWTGYDKLRQIARLK